MNRLGASFGALLLVALGGLYLSGCDEDEAAQNSSRLAPVEETEANGSGSSDGGEGANAKTISVDATASVDASANTEVLDATFDDIKLELEKDEPFADSKLTPEVEKFFGRKMRIRGYILPSFQQSGIKQFVLVRDNLECCFGPGAALYDCILVDMVAGQSADFSVRPVTVEGRFKLNPIFDIEGKHLAIYHLDGESVQ